MTIVRARSRARSIGLAAVFVLALCAVPANAGAEAVRDSLDRFVWGAVYTARLAAVRASEAFPWNDEASESHLAGRFAVYGESRLRRGVSIFLKGSSGRRLEGWDRENRFMLDQGHAAFAAAGGFAGGRLFLRERLFATSHRLMEIVSDESPFLEGRCEGLAVSVRGGSLARAEYIEAAARSSTAIERSGGLPLFRGGADVFRMLRLEVGGSRRVRVGAILSELRSMDAGDAVTVGVDVGVRARGAAFIAELARSHRGGWEDFADARFFDLDIDGFELEAPSTIFSDQTAFAGQIEGLSFRAGRFGSLGLVPGYRFVGASFINPQGELEPGSDETSALAWWRPERSDAILSLEAADGRRREETYRRAACSARLRYRGGFELSSRLAAAEGERVSLVLSTVSDTKRARTLLASRLDDIGGRNTLAFFARTSMRISGSVTAGGSIYCFESSATRYTVEFEFRPRERFLLTARAGSFAPAFEEAFLRFAAAPLATVSDRALVISGRVSLGGMDRQ